ncbi:MAG: hypothetical protein SFY66_11790 [Oculatellaceae cyanobacterium bins.114]|nr:hypothetical protein [Oculatellaceae cyanobacterium bins.114]
MVLCRFYWKTLRLTYPWGLLIVRLWSLLVVTGDGKQFPLQRDRHSLTQIRVWVLLAKIDFANLLAIAIELAQPEFWI